MVSCFYSQQQ